MSEKVFTKEEWLQVLRDLRSMYRLFVPVREDDFHTFEVFDNVQDPDFNYLNTRLSPKTIIYPQSERILEATLDDRAPDAHIYKRAPKEISLTAIVGIRPCDAQAFQIVRVNFDNIEYRDPWWVSRFEATTLVGLGCNEPCDTCFCTSLGGGPFSKKGLDVLLQDLGETYLARALTQKGEVFLNGTRRGVRCEDSVMKNAEELASLIHAGLPRVVHTERLRDLSTTELFDAPFWEEVAFACINCGTCTYLCPTCWCFDIQDEVAGKLSDRIRNWDSCMFPLFTLHGSGHNPRGRKLQRVRQRFMHKLKYYADRYQNGIQCSGCGRCVRFCPVNTDIRRVAELMNRYQKSGVME